MMWRNAGRFSRETGDTVLPRQRQQQEQEFDSALEEDREEQEQPSVLSITRRQPAFGEGHMRREPLQLSSPLQLAKARDIATLQQFWTEHATKASSLYPPSLWRILNAVLDQSKTCQDKVLQSVVPLLSSREREAWPNRRAYIDDKLSRTLGIFHARVTRHASIDLSHFKLHGLEDPIQFEFLDPVFAWTVRADKLIRSNIKLHFDYGERQHPVFGVPLYGASVANGVLFKKACAKLPTPPNECVMTCTSRHAHHDVHHTTYMTT